jgi:hypothetical protein
MTKNNYFRFAWHAFGSVGPYLLSLRFGGWGRLAPMSLEPLVDRMANLVAVRRFPGMGTVESRFLVNCVVTVTSAHNISFVDLLIFLSAVFGGMYGENSCNVFLLLFMVLWVPILATFEWGQC